MSDPLLPILHEHAEQCASAAMARHPDWPCRKGCDLCCRRLARLPELTGEEWRLLESGVRALPGEVRRQIVARMEAVGATAPYVCPLLDPQAGACLVYEQRPVACRTYGLYVERDKGLYCDLIRERVDRGEFADVVWGNQELVDRQLDSCGARTGMLEWFATRGRSVIGFEG